MKDDTISRRAALDALCEEFCGGHEGCGFYPCDSLDPIQKLPSAQPIDVQEAYYRGKIDGIKECTARLKKVNEEVANERMV